LRAVWVFGAGGFQPAGALGGSWARRAAVRHLDKMAVHPLTPRRLGLPPAETSGSVPGEGGPGSTDSGSTEPVVDAGAALGDSGSEEPVTDAGSVPVDSGGDVVDASDLPEQDGGHRRGHRRRGSRCRADVCVPMTVYGPMPCTDDTECVESYGEGWYCDQENTYDDGCGNTTVWPVCIQGSTVGRRRSRFRRGRRRTGCHGGRRRTGCHGGRRRSGCRRGRVCAEHGLRAHAVHRRRPVREDNGEGGTGDQENSYGDGCGGTSVWPICKES